MWHYCWIWMLIDENAEIESHKHEMTMKPKWLEGLFVVCQKNLWEIYSSETERTVRLFYRISDIDPIRVIICICGWYAVSFRHLYRLSLLNGEKRSIKIRFIDTDLYSNVSIFRLDFRDNRLLLFGTSYVWILFFGWSFFFLFFAVLFCSPCVFVIALSQSMFTRTPAVKLSGIKSNYFH